MKTLFKFLDFGTRVFGFRDRYSLTASFLPFIIFFSSFLLKAQVYSEVDIDICNSKFQIAIEEEWQNLPIGDLIAEIGKSFIGTEYAAKTLEVDGEEQLVINLIVMDCTTFLESSLALSRSLKNGDTTFQSFQNELTFIRYRDGIINQYPSRLHYFTDWIYDNEKKRIVKDITEELGGEPFRLNLSFMSSHPQYYKHLTETPEYIPVIKEQEEEISKRNYYYIPRERLEEIEEKIQDGDILAFSSDIKGLDVNHVGIAVRTENNKIHLLHAPNVGYTVEISELPLSDYAKKTDKHLGVIVVRPSEPSKFNLPFNIED